MQDPIDGTIGETEKSLTQTPVIWIKLLYFNGGGPVAPFTNLD